MGQTYTQSAVTDGWKLAVEVEGIIAEARQCWKLDNQWQIEWKWVEPNGKMSASESDEAGWTQKQAYLKLDSRLKKEWHSKLRYEIYHELGHCVVEIIWRTMSDWADHKIQNENERAIWEEAVNSAENILIDHFVVQVFGIH